MFPPSPVRIRCGIKASEREEGNGNASPSSLHSSGGLAFLASLGSSHDVVLVLWLRGERDGETEPERDGWGGRGDLAGREEVGGIISEGR